MRATQPFAAMNGPIRVIPGPQSDHFSDDALDALTAQPWVTTSEQDRMGVRLNGERLVHRTAAHADNHIRWYRSRIYSSARQRFAHRLARRLSDDGRVSQNCHSHHCRSTPPGSHASRYHLSLRIVDHARAAHALQTLDQSMDDWLRTIEPYTPTGFLDARALFSENLVSGFLRADSLD